MKRRLAVLALAVVLLSGCGEKRSATVRIYDPEGKARPELTTSDFVRSSTKATRVGGSWVLSLRLTRRGAAKFHTLTRRLAERGRRMHEMQAFALDLGGHTSGEIAVDYRSYPKGLSGDQGIDVRGLRGDAARKLADEIRGT